MSTDVLPEPVGPSIKLNAPFLKITSLSMRRRKGRLEGVEVPSVLLLDQEKSACPNPMSSWCSTERRGAGWAVFGANESSSSVCQSRFR